MARSSGHPKPKRMTVKQWSRALAKYGKDENDLRFSRYMGLSPGGVATHLNVGRPMVNHLIRTGQLDVIELTDRTDSIVAWICTDASVDRYIQTKATNVHLRNGK